MDLGIKTREWAQSEGKALTEASHYSSVLSALGFAKLLNGQLKDGTPLFLEAHDVVPDMLNSLNLAASLILEGRKSDALKVLDQQKQIRVSVESQVDVCKKLSSQTYYLIRALAINDEELPDKIAHLLCYLERPTSSVDIQRIASSNPQDILSQALNRLKASQGSDLDFLLIPGFEALFELKK